MLQHPEEFLVPNIAQAGAERLPFGWTRHPLAACSPGAGSRTSYLTDLVSQQYG